MENAPSMNSASSRPPVALETFLLGLSGVWVLAGVGTGSAVICIRYALSQDAPLQVWGIAAGSLLLGLTIGMAFWALAVLVRRQYHSTLLQRQQIVALEQVSGQLSGLKTQFQSPADSTADTDLMLRVLSELGDINANLLLTESQREIKRKQSQMRQGLVLARAVEEALAVDQIEEAENAMRRLLAEIPDYPEAASLQERLDQRRHAVTERRIEEMTLRVRDLMAAGNFDQALSTARSLAERFPKGPGGSLVEMVQREKAAYEVEQRRTLYSQIHQYADARQWRSALAAARIYLERNPNASEAALVRGQLPTLTDNAQIEEVRQMRDEFRDLIGRQRFMEAFEVARDLVDRFPNSAAAAELRGQMDRLAARAKEVKEEK